MRTELLNERTLQIQRTEAKFTPALEATDRDYRESIQRIQALVSGRFTLASAFGLGKEDCRVPENLDHKLNQDLLTSTSERWKHAAATVDEDCRTFDAYVAKQWHGEFYLHQPPPISDPADPEHAHRRFQARLESALRRFVMSIQMTECLEASTTLTRKQVRRFPWVMLVLSLVVTFVFWYWGWVAGLCAAAVLVLTGVGMLVSIRRVVRSGVEALVSQFDTSRPVLLTMLRDQLSEETRSMFATFDTVLQPPGEEAQAREQAVRAIDQQLQALRGSLEGLRRGLRLDAVV
jgi:hypothetical protein